MSTTVKLEGFVAALLNPILDSQKREDLDEDLYDQKTNLSINYEGTLIYLSKSDKDFYGLTLGAESSTPLDTKSFVNKCAEYGVEIVVDSIRPFQEIYYNGTDSLINMLTLEKFMNN